jgi:hypothetical protein
LWHAVVLNTIDLYEGYVSKTFSSAVDGAGGTSGIFGTDFETIYKEYYAAGHGLTVGTALFAAVNMAIPVDGASHLKFKFDLHASRAIKSLPPPSSGPISQCDSTWYMS